MRNTNKGFTLVELIVVITILAILGTIAFISLGSYTADARNSTRLDGISKIATAVDNGLISGTSILAYISDATSLLTGASAGGVTLTGGINYNAGNINASALNVNADQFKDPSGGQGFKLGATTKGGSRFEVAASLEEGSTRKAALKGTYVPRTVTGTVAASFSTGSALTLTDIADVNYFNVGDTLTTYGAITNISPDGTQITVTTAPLLTGTGLVDLAAVESTGLLGSAAAAATAVSNNSTTALPY